MEKKAEIMDLVEEYANEVWASDRTCGTEERIESDTAMSRISDEITSRISALELDAQRYRKLQDFFGGATPEEWGELHSHPDLNTAVDALITE